MLNSNKVSKMGQEAPDKLFSALQPLNRSDRIESR